MLHILQECWKAGQAAEEALEAGRPPELAQPYADYEAQRMQILGQLEMVCSRVKGACTPQFVVEQVIWTPIEWLSSPIDNFRPSESTIFGGRCSPRRFKRDGLNCSHFKTAVRTQAT